LSNEDREVLENVLVALKKNNQGPINYSEFIDMSIEKKKYLQKDSLS
jgi:Ca2+-binding EF-hand superfamily protein